MPDPDPPSTSAFPVDPSQLNRDELERLYLRLRNNYKSVQLSRGYYRGHSQRQGEQIRELSLNQFQQSEQLSQRDQLLGQQDQELRQQAQQLRERIAHEASLKREAYALLAAITEVMEHLEAAGDEVSNSFAAQQLGGRRPAGGGSGYGSAGLMAGGASMPLLIKGVLHFLHRWRLGKQRFQHLLHRRDNLNVLLEAGDGRDH